MGGCGGVGGMPQVTPGLLPSHRRQPHTPVDKDTGKKAESPCGTAQASKSPPAAPSLSEPGEGRGGAPHYRLQLQEQVEISTRREGA